ncbi:MAG: NAD-dependent epimerase/dehydratase family protein [Candidatus Calescibacterium sp.]|nr:NAD-dependent epimerase/dehydratase family protein [Candidatus Calescibacterium sp.]MCS7244452.1 NAD-dependent epimerase/dehydratase family protein [Candidatus Calescibacterium sp.]MDW8133375.1 NAD-dependent epimerase/dehydratase family protein [Candidatus Calescibacterium sp.]
MIKTTTDYLKDSRVLVIGGAGFIGSFVVEELLKENVKEVIIYDNFTRGKIDNIKKYLDDKRCYVFPYGGDIRDIDILDRAFEGIDFVFHLAAMWLLHCMDFPRTAFEVNIYGTFNVLEMCVKHKVKKLIFSSSASVYGDAVEIPMTETHPFNNKNFYGATKISGEAMLTAFHHRYGLNAIGLRYMNIYGPRQDEKGAYSGVIPTVLKRIDHNESIVINGDGSQAYDFVYVKDAAYANICALKSDVNFGFYNVATGVQTSIRQLVDTILDLTGAKIDVIYKPYDVGDERQFVKNRIGCPLRAEKDLGFKYRYTLRDGLKEYIEWRKK